MIVCANRTKTSANTNIVKNSLFLGTVVKNILIFIGYYVFNGGSFSLSLSLSIPENCNEFRLCCFEDSLRTHWSSQCKTDLNVQKLLCVMYTNGGFLISGYTIPVASSLGCVFYSNLLLAVPRYIDAQLYSSIFFHILMKVYVRVNINEVNVMYIHNKKIEA